MYFQDDLKSLTSARPTSKTRISNWQIGLIFSLMA
jgi:hypothetical protein